MKDQTIIDERPVYASDHFHLRLLEERDAEDLLQCYSDRSAVRLMNPDNCLCDFYFGTPSEMSDAVRGWIRTNDSRWGAYKGGACVRFSIIDTQANKAIGTIEMFDKTPDTGILRIDLCSAYEKRECILEIIELSTGKFHDAFGVKHVLVKAIPDAIERISALCACGFNETTLPPGEIWWTWIDGKKKRVYKSVQYGDYYVHERT